MIAKAIFPFLIVPVPVSNSQSSTMQLASCNGLLKTRSLWALGIVLYHGYMAYALYYHFNRVGGDAVSQTEAEDQQHWDWCEGLGLMLVLTGSVYIGLIVKLGFYATREWRKTLLSKIPRLTGKWQIIPYVMGFTCITVFLVFDTQDDRRRLLSAAGVIVFVVILALFSKHRNKINWRQVQLHT